MSLTARGMGCATLNSTTYSTAGLTFDILCDRYWGHEDILAVTYALSFPFCINGCVHTDKCVGVDWTFGTYGPGGVSGGSLCRYLWSMTDSDGVVQKGDDSARLQLQYIPFPSVLIPFLSDSERV